MKENDINQLKIDSYNMLQDITKAEKHLNEMKAEYMRLTNKITEMESANIV